MSVEFNDKFLYKIFSLTPFQTFHHAKLMQFTILGVGLMFAVYEESPLLLKVNNMLQDFNKEDYRGKNTVIDWFNE